MMPVTGGHGFKRIFDGLGEPGGNSGRQADKNDFSEVERSLRLEVALLFRG